MENFNLTAVLLETKAHLESPSVDSFQVAFVFESFELFCDKLFDLNSTFLSQLFFKCLTSDMLLIASKKQATARI